MAIMTHRTTFSLDATTVQRIRSLASSWNVSQAEVIRRVVARVEGEEHPDPVAMLQQLHQSGEGLTVEQATIYLNEVRDIRHAWRGR